MPADKSKPQLTQNEPDKNQATAGLSNPSSLFANNPAKKDEPKVSPGLFSQNSSFFSQIGAGIQIGVEPAKPSSIFTNLGSTSFAPLPSFKPTADSA